MGARYSPTLTQLELAELTNNVSASDTFGRPANTDVLLLDPAVFSGIYGFLVLNISALNPQQQNAAASTSSSLQVWVIVAPILAVFVLAAVIIILIQRRFALYDALEPRLTTM